MKIREAVEAFLDYRRGLRQSPLTIKAMSYSLSLFARHLEGEGVLNVEEIRREHLEKWQSFLSFRKVRGLPCATETVNNKLCAVRSLLAYLAGHGHIPKSLECVLKPLKVPRRLPLGVFEHRQIAGVLEGMDTSSPLAYRDRTILELLYSTGIRVSELTGLDADRIDFKSSTLRILGKGSKERMVPVGKTAARFLLTYMRAVRPFLMKSPEEKAVFLGLTDGGRLSPSSVEDIVHRHCDGKGFKTKVTPHTFRRSCATELIKSGGNPYHVKEFLGHESLNTLKRYVNLSANEVRGMHAKCNPRERDEEE